MGNKKRSQRTLKRCLKTKVNQKVKQNHKDQVLIKTVAIVLCCLLGGLGIHRFYLGYYGMGVLYLLTGGLCGIGVIIDLIKLINGDLQPLGGSFDES